MLMIYLVIIMVLWEYQLLFFDKYNPEQFELLDARDYALNDKQKNKNTFLIKDIDSAINGKPVYARIVIRKRIMNNGNCD